MRRIEKMLRTVDGLYRHQKEGRRQNQGFSLVPYSAEISNQMSFGDDCDDWCRIVMIGVQLWWLVYNCEDGHNKHTNAQ